MDLFWKTAKGIDRKDDLLYHYVERKRFQYNAETEDFSMGKVTIKDVAKAAGVSYATVSRAFSDSSEIGDATKGEY